MYRKAKGLPDMLIRGVTSIVMVYELSRKGPTIVQKMSLIIL